MLKEGRSWSGHERNCAFLNLGENRFATISATSGFDFLDDARGIGLIDWDFDGDLDLWVTNRSAPQVRFLRNEIGQENRFLAIHLEGNGITVNRDAVGARLELTQGEGENRVSLIRAVRAGEGFLSQNSRWVSFGLEKRTAAAQLKIRWPDGREDRFTDLEVDRWIRIRQGKTAAEASEVKQWTHPVFPEMERPPAADRVSKAQPVRAWVARRPLLPILPYGTADGGQTTVQETFFASGSGDGPVYLMFWSENCGHCAVEMKEWAAAKTELERAGLRILLLNVDLLAGEGQIPNVNQEFPGGFVTREAMEKLDVLKRSVFSLVHPFVTPSGILLDESGKVAAFYHGRLAPGKLVDDLTHHLPNDGPAERNEETSFSGRWNTKDFAGSILAVANEFRASGFEGEWKRYSDQGAGERARKLYNEATTAAGEKELSRAIELFREALELDPEHSPSHCNLGVVLCNVGKVEEGRSHLERAVELNPGEATAHYMLGLLVQDENPEEATTHYLNAISADSELVEAHQNLAVIFLRTGRVAEGVRHLWNILDANPDRLRIALQLARILATYPDEEVRDAAEAVRLAQEVARSFSTEPFVLDTLAAAYANAGAWKPAVTVAEQAEKMAEALGEADLAAAISRRIELYKRRKPFRESGASKK